MHPPCEAIPAKVWQHLIRAIPRENSLLLSFIGSKAMSLYGLAVGLVASIALCASYSASILASSNYALSGMEMRYLVTGGDTACTASVAEFPCNNHSQCEGKPEGSCSGDCSTCTAPDLMVRICQTTGVLTVKDCVILSAEPDCGVVLEDATCQWDSGSAKCICDGLAGITTCGRFDVHASTKCKIQSP